MINNSILNFAIALNNILLKKKYSGILLVNKKIENILNILEKDKIIKNTEFIIYFKNLKKSKYIIYFNFLTILNLVNKIKNIKYIKNKNKFCIFNTIQKNYQIISTSHGIMSSIKANQLHLNGSFLLHFTLNI